MAACLGRRRSPVQIRSPQPFIFHRGVGPHRQDMQRTSGPARRGVVPSGGITDHQSWHPLSPSSNPVRTLPFQGKNGGSNPLGDTNYGNITIVSFGYIIFIFCFLDIFLICASRFNAEFLVLIFSVMSNLMGSRLRVYFDAFPFEWARILRSRSFVIPQ